jgi:hypothetical protein
MNRRQPCGICGDFDHLTVECYQYDEDNNLTQLRTGTLGLTESRRDPFKRKKAA